MVSRRSVLYGICGVGLGSATYAGLQDDTSAETDTQTDAETMGTQSFFSHTHEGRNGGDRLARAGVDMQTWGENIVYTWWDRSLNDGKVLTSASEVAYWRANWWLNSPEHRANIMDPRFDAHATGFYRTDADKILGVELFGKAE